MHIHVVDHNTAHRQRIEMLVAEVAPGSTLTMARTHDDHSLPAAQADLVIISGGTWLVHKNPGTHNRLMDTLVNSSKPIFAICLGAEATARFFGANLIEMNTRRQGVIDINLINSNLITTLAAKQLPVYEYHKWAFSNLPGSLESLAESEDGVELFRHKTLPIWGTQFHPEVRRDTNQGYRIFEYALIQMGLLLTDAKHRHRKDRVGA
jgi:GMP synthase (glutamine-hydrolysing)